jgi:acetyl-CoA carboxylase biotin carboxylase subunit
MPVRRLLIANRGEIAVRIIRAAREMGIETIQAHSTADADSLAVRLADRAVNIGPSQAAKSYLNKDAIIEAAQATSADAIHPGYGFLAENAAFADAVERAGLVFVGPRGETIRQMGDKVAARDAARKAGVPTVPGSVGIVADIEAARGVVAETGFPVMIKAAAGGGGRGIRVARDWGEFEQLFGTASAEAKAAFGDGGLYVEKLIERARHIEVQVLGDGSDVVHLYERECSLQRRRQKVWEEAPSSVLAPEVRQALCDSAVALAAAVAYRGAGTIEYLYDDATGGFYFIEMNTRIQVEHPVTELVTGVDLMREMIAIAGGAPLSLRQEDIAVEGHAIEVRINAEDPAKGFAPFPGKVDDIRIPQGPHIRFDTHLYPGYTVPPFYDSLLGKLVVRGVDRADAIARLADALRELKIGGLPTTAELHRALVANEEVRAGGIHTGWLERWLESNAHRLIRTMETT